MTHTDTHLRGMPLTHLLFGKDEVKVGARAIVKTHCKVLKPHVLSTEPDWYDMSVTGIGATVNLLSNRYCTESRRLE